MVRALSGNYLKNKPYIKVGFKPAFTMLELVFVIVILGILASVAIPRLVATRDDAIIVKGKSQISAIRSGIAMQKAKALLEGRNRGIYNANFRLIRLDKIISGFESTKSRLFNFEDGNESNILEFPIFSKNDSTGGWMKTKLNTYTFEIKQDVTVEFDYNITTGIFGCTQSPNCRLLTN